jgi:capsular polysaccharide transport system permease protein
MKAMLARLNGRNLRIGLIAVPWLVSALYLVVFAADRYVAESVVAVRENGDTPVAGVDALSTLFGSSAPASRDDELLLEAHILSMDMLQRLDQRLGLRAAFSAPRTDPLFRLAGGARQEQFLSYYRDRIEVRVDERSGLIRVRTQAFTPELAAGLNREIIAISERFINESSHRLAREQMEFAENELKKARHQLDHTRAQLVAFQEKHGVLDPVAQATANTGVTVELQAAIARQEAELKSMLNYLNEDAPPVRAIKANLEGTRAQLEVESRRAMSSADGTSLNVLASSFQELFAEVEFAQDSYKLALTAVETARVESTRKLKSLVLVESPAVPESPEYPRRIYTLVALSLALGLLYGIARLVVATIEDHQQ